MRKIMSALILNILAIVLFSGNVNAEKIKSVNSVTWDINSLGKLYFPEIDDKTYKVSWLQERKSFGIAFSGGGTRSASATLGQLRTLHELGWLENAKYISAISGGAWASIPYTYYSKNDQQLLGKYIAPKKLQKDDLKKTNKKSLAKAIAKSSVGLKAVKSWFSFKKDETFSTVVGNIFLKRLDLFGKKFFAFQKESVDSILKNNKTSGLKHDDFYTVKKGRPYLLVSGTFISKDVKSSSSYYPLEISGLYVGIRKPQVAKTKRGDTKIGGGYVQPLAYDTNTPLDIKKGIVEVPLSSKRRKFTLSDVVGITGSAPQHVLGRLHIKDIGFPELKYWAIDQESKVYEYRHGDGGHLDNLGIMPLLVRQVKNILVFANSYKPLNENKNLDIKSYFMPVDANGLFAGYQKNKVFENGKYTELEKGLKEKIGKEPLVYCDEYQVSKNVHYGVIPYTANVCWVYLNENQQWLKQVSQSNIGKELKNRFKNKKPSFERFPHYKTFLENSPNIINLSNVQVNALAHLTSWVLCKSQYTISNALVGDGLSLSTESLNCD